MYTTTYAYKGQFGIVPGWILSGTVIERGDEESDLHLKHWEVCGAYASHTQGKIAFPI